MALRRCFRLIFGATLIPINGRLQALSGLGGPPPNVSDGHITDETGKMVPGKAFARVGWHALASATLDCLQTKICAR
ncbi:MAG: hypothetical protein ACI8PT_003227 [Gammaproteobacteria bacterium]|jgi:hypothetical protein